VLQERAELQAALQAALQRAAIARARLQALRSGGKDDDIRAAQSEVLGEEARLASVTAEARRTRALGDMGLVSAAAIEAQEAQQAVAARAVEARRARLKSLSSLRPADVVVSQTELQAAEAAVDEVRARLDGTLVRAPAAGRVLAIHARAGQAVGREGVLSFGRTDEMLVDAEVLEEDVARTRVGQKVRISGDVLPAPVTGSVQEIGYLVGSREVFRSDPTAFADSRIVHVKVRADDAAALARFINARVTVEIGP
jgi:HlyD family secretion protein